MNKTPFLIALEILANIRLYSLNVNTLNYTHFICRNLEVIALQYQYHSHDEIFNKSITRWCEQLSETWKMTDGSQRCWAGSKITEILSNISSLYAAFIHPSIHLSLTSFILQCRVTASWSQSQLTTGERQGRKLVANNMDALSWPAVQCVASRKHSFTVICPGLHHHTVPYCSTYRLCPPALSHHRVCRHFVLRSHVHVQSLCSRGWEVRLHLCYSIQTPAYILHLHLIA